MAHWPFRFIHAADFHLEQPLCGLEEVPEHLRDVLIDAPYRAAERVFDTVLAEEADFLVLSGDILDPQRTGPRGPLFLAQQFERLADRKIAVYWAGGDADSLDAWPSAVRLPDVVHQFPLGRIDEYVHQRDGVPVARLVGTSRRDGHSVQPADFASDPGGLFTIAVVHGLPDATVMAARGVHYWALGGSHTRRNLRAGPATAHHPGTPQGRRPSHCGPYGCTLVPVDAQGQLRTTFVPADAVRWHREKVPVDQHTTPQALETQLAARTEALRAAHPTLDLLIVWTVAGSGPLLRRLRSGGLAAELLAKLRKQYGFTSPAAWSVALEADPQDAFPPAAIPHETICGDFLRALSLYQTNPNDPLHLEAFLPEQQLPGSLRTAADLADPVVRQRVLREAVLLGIDLLSGEESQP